jgi:hypothetical protein
MDFSFSYKGLTYQIDKKYCYDDMLNSTAEFHYSQFMFLIETQDWTTLDNRIINQLRHGGLLIVN